MTSTTVPIFQRVPEALPCDDGNGNVREREAMRRCARQTGHDGLTVSGNTITCIKCGARWEQYGLTTRS